MGSKPRAGKKTSAGNDYEKLRRDFARGWYEHSGAYGSISRTKSIPLPKPRRLFKSI